ncbi:Mobile element protein [Microcystis aeruginosa NIES-98]|nr:Mobile element protein [Microcystis aeruginosa NIES-98]
MRRGKRQKAKGKRQKAKGKRQKAKGKRQKAKGKRQLCSPHTPHPTPCPHEKLFQQTLFMRIAQTICA